jgi:hypothetical protein
MDTIIIKVREAEAVRTQEAMGEMLLAELHSAIPVVIMRPTFFKDPLLGWMQGTRYRRSAVHS